MVAVSTATVSRWSNGKATPDLRTQTVVAELRYVVDRSVHFSYARRAALRSFFLTNLSFFPAQGCTLPASFCGGPSLPGAWAADGAS